MSRRQVAPLGVPALLVVAASAASANAGSMYIATGCCHLVFVNAAIGLLEAGLLRALWKVPWRPAAMLLVPANYASWLAGCVVSYPLAWGVRAAMAGDPLGRARPAAAGAYAVLLIVSIVVEWPFVRWALRGAPVRSSNARALAASAVVNLLTAGLVVLPYLPITDLSIYRNTVVDRGYVASTEDDAWVYFVDRDHTLCRVRVNGTRCEQVDTTPLPRDAVGTWRLTPLALTRTKDGLSDLVVQETDRAGLKPQEYQESVLVRGIASGLPRDADPERVPKGAAVTFGWARYGWTWEPPESLRWHARSWLNDSAAMGITRADAPRQTPSTPLGLQLPPFVRGHTSHAWLLSHDRVLFQLGRNWVVLYGCETRQIGMLVAGSDPVVIPDSVAGPGAATPGT